jgi:hypothetical protein
MSILHICGPDFGREQLGVGVAELLLQRNELRCDVKSRNALLPDTASELSHLSKTFSTKTNYYVV